MAPDLIARLRAAIERYNGWVDVALLSESLAELERAGEDSARLDVALDEVVDGTMLYPRSSPDYEIRTEYMNGWNDGVKDVLLRMSAAIDASRKSK